jgi:hypothetical protein
MRRLRIRRLRIGPRPPARHWSVCMDAGLELATSGQDDKKTGNSPPTTSPLIILTLFLNGPPVQGGMKRKIEIEDHPPAARLAAVAIQCFEKVLSLICLLGNMRFYSTRRCNDNPPAWEGGKPEQRMGHAACRRLMWIRSKLRVFPLGQTPILSQCRPVCGPSPSEWSPGCRTGLKKICYDPCCGVRRSRDGKNLIN